MKRAITICGTVVAMVFIAGQAVDAQTPPAQPAARRPPPRPRRRTTGPRHSRRGTRGSSSRPSRCIPTRCSRRSSWPRPIRWKSSRRRAGRRSTRTSKVTPWPAPCRARPGIPSVKSLVAFPSVLEKMNEKIDWTQKLGDAFLAQQKEVMQAVQVLRNKAKETGNLKSTKEVTVKEEPAPAGSPAPQTIIIESPNPEVVYVPTYNPTVVYGAWAYPMYPPYPYYPPGYAYGAAFWSFTAGVDRRRRDLGQLQLGRQRRRHRHQPPEQFQPQRDQHNRNSNNTGNRTATTAAIAPATTARAQQAELESRLLASQRCGVPRFGHAAEIQPRRQSAERRGARAVPRPRRAGPPADEQRGARQSA